MNGYLKLVSSDWIKGIVITVIAAVLVSIQSALTGDSGVIFTAEFWQEVLKVAVTAGIAYLIKNLATNNQNELAGIKATKPRD